MNDIFFLSFNGIILLALIGLFGVVTNFVTKDLMQLKENKSRNKSSCEQ